MNSIPEFIIWKRRANVPEGLSMWPERKGPELPLGNLVHVWIFQAR